MIILLWKLFHHIKKWTGYKNTKDEIASVAVKALYSFEKGRKVTNNTPGDKPLAVDSDSDICSVFSSPLDSSTSATVVNSGSLL